MTVSLNNTIVGKDVSFGTSGLRGTVEDLSEEVVASAARAFVAHMRVKAGDDVAQRLYLAYDLRPSSPKIARQVASALVAEGVTVTSFGAIPTPALALQSIGDGVPAIMVTGSHIPFDRNGLKFYDHLGEISKVDEKAIATGTLARMEHSTEVDLIVSDTARSGYIGRYVDAFPGLLAGKRVGVYQHSAVGRDINCEVFEQLGATVTALGRSDTFVPVDTEAVSAKDRAQARDWAREHELDFVFSTDGDGDRPLMSDETGAYFDGDLLGILTARFLGVGTVVTPITSNSRLEKTGWFEAVSRTKVGSPYVLASMAEAKAEPIAGFEANGGFLLQSQVDSSNADIEGRLAALPTRDALLPALATFALAKQLNCRLSELRQLVGQRVKMSDRLQDVPKASSLALLESLESSSAERADFFADLGSVAEIDTLDGLRVTLDDGRIAHLRPSGNAPELRVYVETDTEAASADLLAQMLKRAKAAIA